MDAIHKKKRPVLSIYQKFGIFKTKEQSFLLGGKILLLVDFKPFFHKICTIFPGGALCLKSRIIYANLTKNLKPVKKRKKAPGFPDTQVPEFPGSQVTGYPGKKNPSVPDGEIPEEKFRREISPFIKRKCPGKETEKRRKKTEEGKQRTGKQQENSRRTEEEQKKTIENSERKQRKGFPISEK